VTSSTNWVGEEQQLEEDVHTRIRRLIREAAAGTPVAHGASNACPSRRTPGRRRLVPRLGRQGSARRGAAQHPHRRSRHPDSSGRRPVGATAGVVPRLQRRQGSEDSTAASPCCVLCSQPLLFHRPGRDVCARVTSPAASTASGEGRVMTSVAVVSVTLPLLCVAIPNDRRRVGLILRRSETNGVAPKAPSGLKRAGKALCAA
jgi:hypothetical protein